MSQADNSEALLAMIARSVDVIGTEKFSESIAQLCLQTSNFGSIYISAYFRDHKPCEIFSSLNKADTASTIPPYLNFAYLLDPFYDLFKQDVGDKVVFLSECAPDNFRSTDYYRLFYGATGLLDECCIFIRIQPSASVVLSLGNRSKHIQNTKKVKQQLESLLPLLASLCRRHWPKLEPTSLDGTGRLGHYLERSFVKVHRKRTYTKLNITSQGELFSIFLEALSKTPPNLAQDPLTFIDTGQFGKKSLV